jgi:hypothetical protein
MERLDYIKFTTGHLGKAAEGVGQKIRLKKASFAERSLKLEG